MNKDNDLKQFRNNWLEELQAKKPKRDVEFDSSVKSTGTELGTGRNTSFSDKDIVQDGVQSSAISSKSFHPASVDNYSHLSAFEIVNSCLVSANTFEPSNELSTKDEDFQSESKKAAFAAEENLLECLISDIDEVTAIPFFDLELPKEVAVRIFSYLGLNDLLSCCAVNRSWKCLAEDDLIWFNICKRLDVNTGVDSLLDGSQWKAFVKDALLKRDTLIKNWRERICHTMELQYEQGGILCSASLSREVVVAGYLDGSVILWDIRNGFQQTTLNYGSRHTREDNGTDKHVVDTSVDNGICAAAFGNGDVKLWHVDCGSSVVYERNSGKGVCIVAVDSSPQFNSAVLMTVRNKMLTLDKSDELGNWSTICDRTFDSDIIHLERLAENTSAVVTSMSLSLLTGSQVDEIERSVGAVITAADCTPSNMACALHYKGFHLLGGFRVKLFDAMSGKLVHILKGPHCSVSCMNIRDSPRNSLVAGCTDYKLRVYDTRIEKAASSFLAQRSRLTKVQMDDYKVVSGAMSGSVCVWDRRMTSTHLWEHQMKHPIRLCRFIDNVFVTAAVPLDRHPQESLWYIDDLIQHRRLRGTINVLDFDTSNYVSKQVPDICQSTYDDMSGYNYNISLVTPFDDVVAGNLPQL